MYIVGYFLDWLRKFFLTLADLTVYQFPCHLGAGYLSLMNSSIYMYEFFFFFFLLISDLGDKYLVISFGYDCPIVCNELSLQLFKVTKFSLGLPLFFFFERK
jgi:hypothetical protein